MRPVVSSLHPRTPNFLTEPPSEDDIIVREWLLVLKGDGKSPRTLEGYGDFIRQLSAFLRRGRIPAMRNATAEHIRKRLNALRERGNKPATVNARYRAVSALYQLLVKEGEIRESAVARIEPRRVPETVQVITNRSRLRRFSGLSGAVGAADGYKLTVIDSAGCQVASCIP